MLSLVSLLFITFKPVFAVEALMVICHRCTHSARGFFMNPPTRTHHLPRPKCGHRPWKSSTTFGQEATRSCTVLISLFATLITTDFFNDSPLGDLDLGTVFRLTVIRQTIVCTIQLDQVSLRISPFDAPSDDPRLGLGCLAPRFLTCRSIISVYKYREPPRALI